jgi:LysM repeat protein
MSAVPGRHARPRTPFRHRTAAVTAATSLGGLTAALLGGTAAQAATATPTETLVSSYTVVSGDTLSGIAVKEHVPGGWSALAKYNKISSPYVIRTGEKLALPAGSYVLTPAKSP